MERLKDGELHISVRNLVEFMLRSGDIDNRASTVSDVDAMLTGGKIHRKLQKAMGPGYEAEVFLSFYKDYPYYRIVVEGRADGIFVEDGAVFIDEIKTMKSNVRFLEAPIAVHEAQAKCYAYFYWLREREKKETTELSVQMTYCTQETEETKRFRTAYPVSELEAWFLDLLDGYRVWVEFLYQHAKRRNETVRPLPFPFVYRAGQRDMAIAVYRNIAKKKHLFVQAPTGIGKTMSTIYPAVKSMGEGITDKIFYLTAKTIGRTVAEETFRVLQEKGAHLSFLTLTAKEKLCVCESPACNPDACPRAKGHFDRINDAVYDMITHETAMTREKVLAYSEKHTVCPFEYSLDLSYWVDCVIGDYNYVFDPTAKLKRFFAEGNEEPYLFLIDEAHNLVDRARDMYSAVVYKEWFLAGKKIIGDRHKGLKRSFESCNRVMLTYKRACETYQVLPDINALMLPLKWLVEQLSHFFGHVTLDFPGREELLQIYFDLSLFVKTQEYAGEGYRIYCEHDDKGFFVKLYCIDPSLRLSECFSTGNSAVLFSATMLPIQYYKELLTGNSEEDAIYIRSPFDEKNRLLCAARDVTTRYMQRGPGMYERYARYILDTASKKVGNYIVFCPSYVLLQAIREHMEAILYEESYPEIAIAEQESMMGEREKEAFLEQFCESPERTVIGMCVLGGTFSEGIDLAGERLIGAFIVGTGLPQICTPRALVKAYFDEKGENGFDYSYRIPGMNKVQQAAGRVIRTKEDVGVIFLLDDRFRENSNMALFPREWSDIVFGTKKELTGLAETFWKKR